MTSAEVLIIVCVWLAIRVGSPRSGSGLARLMVSPAAPARARRNGRPEPSGGTGGSGAVPAPVLLDLVAEVLASGAPVTRAVAAVGEALDAAGDPSARALLDLATALRAGTAVPGALPAVGGLRPRATRSRQVRSRRAPFGPRGRLGPTSRLVDRLVEALELALATGSSPVALIRAAAQEERRAAAARAAQAARRLGVLVLLPTGLCLLPAFVLLTVVPLALGLALENGFP